MLRVARLTVVGLLLSGGLVILTQGPAAAINCSISRGKTANTTWVSNNTCWRVNARVEKYYDGYVHVSTSGPDFDYAYVANNNGVESGHASKKSLYGTYEIWSDWNYF